MCDYSSTFVILKAHLGQDRLMEQWDSYGEPGLYGAFYTHTKPPASHAEPDWDRRVNRLVSVTYALQRRSRSSYNKLYR